MFEHPIKPKRFSFAFSFSLSEYIKFFLVTLVVLGAMAFWICTFLRFYSLDYKLSAVHPQYKFDASLVSSAFKREKVRIRHSMFGPCLLKINAPLSASEGDMTELMNCSPTGHSFTMVAGGEYWASCSCKFVQVKASRNGPPRMERECCCYDFGKEPPSSFAATKELPRCHINKVWSAEFSPLDELLEPDASNMNDWFWEDMGMAMFVDPNEQQRVVNFQYEFKKELVETDL